MSKESPPLSPDPLLQMAHRLGKDGGQALSPLEGSVSSRADADSHSFYVSAEKAPLAKLDTGGLTRCRLDTIVGLLKKSTVSDQEVKKAVETSHAGGPHRHPSSEALFHAYLLSLPGVIFVGHVHTIEVNKILCSGQARPFAENRLVPEEVAACGPRSVLVPSVPPGILLASRIRDEVVFHQKKCGAPPKLILLENHGLIACGSSPEEVITTVQIAEKAAQIFLGAQQLGGPVFLSKQQVQHLATQEMGIPKVSPGEVQPGQFLEPPHPTK